MTNEEKIKEIIKRLKSVYNQKNNLLNVMNSSQFAENEAIEYSNNFKDLILIEQAFKSEIKVLTID